jgi:hypothetical protein
MVDKLYKAFVDATYNVFNLMLNISEISLHSVEDFKCDDSWRTSRRSYLPVSGYHIS